MLSYPRRMAVRVQQDPEWKKALEYGRRQIVESAFSVIKRLFGECVMAHKTKNMMHEVILRVAIYNRMVVTA